MAPRKSRKSSTETRDLVSAIAEKRKVGKRPPEKKSAPRETQARKAPVKKVVKAHVASPLDSVIAPILQGYVERLAKAAERIAVVFEEMTAIERARKDEFKVEAERIIGKAVDIVIGVVKTQPAAESSPTDPGWTAPVVDSKAVTDTLDKAFAGVFDAPPTAESSQEAEKPAGIGAS